MGSVTSYTKEKIDEIEAASITDVDLTDDEKLRFTKGAGAQFDITLPIPVFPAGSYYTVPIDSGQAWDSVAVDQSELIQDAIDSAFFDNPVNGGVVRLPPGVFYGSFKMRANIILIGSGMATCLRAMPGQTDPVVDYATYSAYHTQLCDLRIDGNYEYGRTDGLTQGNCRGIFMGIDPPQAGVVIWAYNHAAFVGAENIAEDGYMKSLPFLTTEWGNSFHVVNNVMVTRCGGDWGIYLDNNQRGVWMNQVNVNSCKNGAIYSGGTDCELKDIQAGNCGDGIKITAPAQKWSNVKSWYHGQNAGYTGNGNGYTVEYTSLAGLGATVMIGCESQDCSGYGFRLDRANAFVGRGLLSNGDETAAMLISNVRNSDIELYISDADLPPNTKGIITTAAEAQPQNNKIHWSCDLDVYTTASGFIPYTWVSGAVAYGNDWQGPLSQRGIDLRTAYAATLTPIYLKTYLTAAWGGALNVAIPTMEANGAIQPGEEVTIVLRDTTGGNAVTWHANYNGAPGYTTTAGAHSTFRFMYMGANAYNCVGYTLNG